MFEERDCWLGRLWTEEIRGNTKGGSDDSGYGVADVGLRVEGQGSGCKNIVKLDKRVNLRI